MTRKEKVEKCHLNEKSPQHNFRDFYLQTSISKSNLVVVEAFHGKSFVGKSERMKKNYR